jgi:MFS family permease
MDETDQGHPQRWLVLVIVLLGQFMIVGAVGTVNIALPAIQADLGASPSAMQWVLVLYQLGFAVVLVTGGRLGDLWGRKRVFLLGLGGFVAASTVAAVAPTIQVLVAARLAQGMFGGVTSPQVLAVIQVAFTAKERPRAFAAFGMVSGSAFMIGQVMSGALIKLDLFGLNWRSPFLVNLVLGAAALVAAAVVLPETGTTRAQRLDLKGVGLVSAGGLLLLYPLIQGRNAGWPPAFALLLLAAGPVLVTFIRHERRLAETGGEPLVDLALFRTRSFGGGLLVALVYSFSTLPTFYVLTLTLQLGFGFDALEAALATAPTPLAVIAASLLSARLLPRYGRRMVAVAASFGLLASLAIMATMALGPRPLRPIHLIPALILLGANNGFGMTSVVNLTLADVSTEHAGSASGLLQTVQQSAAALGVALAGIVFFGVVGSVTTLDSYVQAMVATLVGTMVSCVLVIALHRRLPPLPHREDSLVSLADG